MLTLFKMNISILALLLGFFFPAPCLSNNVQIINSTDPVKLIKTLSDRIFFILKQHPKIIDKNDNQKIVELLEEELLPYVNIEHTTRLAFGKLWKKATNTQQQQLINLFKKLIVRTYSAYIDQIKDQNIIVFDNILVSKNFVTVRSKVENKALSQSENTILYRLEKTPSGWKVFDVQVASAWLILTYRGQFNDIVNKSPEKSVDELIGEIRRKVGT